MPQSLEILRQEFIQEARSAPKLFRDLAKIEQYLAESYKTRAFIELIQNADDAQAIKFGIHDFAGGFAVGNDGRPFTIEDVEALCRSGASHKHRGGNTIGYRGIGFKSVVNLARVVYVLSGEYVFFFDKVATTRIFPDVSDVPLIRIPHLSSGATDSSLLNEAAQLKINLDYQTLFVFKDLNERLSSEEFLEFDKSSLIFLNNLRFVELAFRGGNRKILVESNWDRNKQHTIRIKEDDAVDEWEVLHSARDAKIMVAMKKFHDNIIPALRVESVFHSFTPTVEFAGAYLKLNGDYSTDPSRKTIDLDEHSQRSFDESVSIISNAIISLLNRQATKRGFFTAFVNARDESQKQLKPHLLKTLAARLQSETMTSSNGETIRLSSLRLHPDWLNYEDYEKLCHGDISPVSKTLLLLYPELMTFLEQMGFQSLLIQEAIEKVNESGISAFGCAQVFSKLVKQYRFDLNDKNVNKLKVIKIFPVNDKCLAACDLNSCSELRNEFVQHLADNNDVSDLKLIFKKLGLTLDHFLTQAPIATPSETIPIMYAPKWQAEQPQTIFTAEPILKQWRSAEKNAEEFIKSLKAVLSVVDVSKANLGYDLEVRLENKRTVYVEVKSVSSFSEPFKLTNNEYSSAHSYGDEYFVALVVNGEPFQIRILRNPIENVEFQKQCERWSWCCETYELKLASIAELVS